MEAQRKANVCQCGATWTTTAIGDPDAYFVAPRLYERLGETPGRIRKMMLIRRIADGCPRCNKSKSDAMPVQLRDPYDNDRD